MKPTQFVVVGSGATGLAAVYTLQKYAADKNIQIHLVESSDRIGGHAWSVPVTPENEEELVDVGFMVLNKETYPNLVRIFKELKVDLEDSDMSLSVFDSTKSWSFQSTYKWLVTMALRPRFWNFVRSHAKFANRARECLANPDIYETTTVGEFCEGLDEDFSNNWLLPFVSAVWSVGEGQSRDFSALPLLRFMDNHRFLTLGTLKWKTPKNRSQVYVNKILSFAKDSLIIHKNSPAKKIHTGSKELELENGNRISYDKLILACSAPNQASLDPPGKLWLENFKVSRSRIVAHTEPFGMPRERSEWSSWNVKGASSNTKGNSVESDKASVTYWLSKIQNLKESNRFVSVNPSEEPNGIFFDEMMEHPVMNMNAFHAQQQEHEHQGKDDIFYAGAWLRNGFHEDAFFTGSLAARRAMNRQDIPVEYPTGSAGIIKPKAILGVTNHSRFGEKQRSFTYPLYLYKWDTRTPPSRFVREDFFGDPSIPLDTLVRQELSERIGLWPMGRIDAVSNLRFAGLTFNPITPFFAHDEAGQLIALLCEVHNTPWGERCLYAMRVNENFELEPRIHSKIMHVSPFNPPPTENETKRWNYHFTLKGEDFISVEVRDDQNEKVLLATWDTTNQSSVPSSTETPTQQNQDQDQHSVKSGSWRTFFWIYFQAFLMIAREGFSMHGYEVEKVSSSGVKVYSLFWSIIPTLLFLFAGQWIVSLLLLSSSLLFMKFQISGGVNLVPLFGFILSFSSLLFALLLQIFSIVDIMMLFGISLLVGGASMFLPSPKTENQKNRFCAFIQTSVIGCIWCFIDFVPMYFIIFGMFYNLILSLPFVQNRIEDFYLNTFTARENLAFLISSTLIKFITKSNISLQRINESTDFESFSPNNMTQTNGGTVLYVRRPIAFFWGLTAGDLGVGESYVAGDWCESQSGHRGEELFKILRIFASFHDSPFLSFLESLKIFLPSYWIRRFDFLKEFGSLDRKSSAASIASHYDDGNDLFRAFLDPDMVYTSALFDDTKPLSDPSNSLEEAQKRKIARILELCNLPENGKVLDIGSGWGALVGHALQRGYEARGLCNCKNMIQFAKQKFGDESFMILDYRDIPDHEIYDGITCVEMIEAVPARDYEKFVLACERSLKVGGRVSMQVINALSFNNPVARKRNPVPLGTFVTTHIFPGQQLPNLEFLHEAFLKSGKFKRIYSETTGHHYARTLALWANGLLENGQNRFPVETINKYLYYLCWCRAAFDAELLQLSRIVFQKE